MKVVDGFLKPLASHPLQAYLDNRIQPFDVIEKVLRETGPAEIRVSTFSTSEEFLRRIYKLKQDGLIKRAILLLDLKAAAKTKKLYRFIGENHSKVILIKNKIWNISIVTSQNQTRGNRAESAVITTDQGIYTTLLTALLLMETEKTLKIDELFNQTT